LPKGIRLTQLKKQLILECAYCERAWRTRGIEKPENVEWLEAHVSSHELTDTLN
jgi:hypothetical protein